MLAEMLLLVQESSEWMRGGAVPQGLGALVLVACMPEEEFVHWSSLDAEELAEQVENIDGVEVMTRGSVRDALRSVVQWRVDVLGAAPEDLRCTRPRQGCMNSVL